MARSTPVLVLALDGSGGHPAAWCAGTGPSELLDPARLVALARTAEAAGFDAVALDDSFDPVPADLGAVPFRLDALLSLAHVAAATTTIGLLATVTVTHTEPFHVSKNVATLDLVSGGRAGWRVATSTSEQAAALFGRRAPEPYDVLVDEAGEVVDVVRALWDSWEDDAVIRDRPTGRYIDRDKVHYVDFEGRWFSVRGPSITPRPPQGQPIVVVDADDHALVGSHADVVVVRGGDAGAVADARTAIRAAVGAAGRDPDDVTVLADVIVGEPARRAALDELAGGRPAGRLELVAPADRVAATIDDWVASGVADGVLIRPDVLPDTLDWLAAEVVAHLDEPPAPTAPGTTLRDRLGLERPANRFASGVAS